MSRFASWLRHEIATIIPTAGFFFVAFQLHIWLFVFLCMYCTLREIIRVLGPARVRAMFFGPLRPDLA